MSLKNLVHLSRKYCTVAALFSPTGTQYALTPACWDAQNVLGTYLATYQVEVLCTVPRVSACPGVISGEASTS